MRPSNSDFPRRGASSTFIKRRFRQNELRVTARAADGGGTGTETMNLALTRLKDDRRLTLGLEYRHTDPLFRSDRGIAPDPDITFDAVGNVRGLNGEIDPALSAAAGHVVRIAGVPDAAADQASLAGYLASTDKPRLFDIGPYRTLVSRNNAIKAEAVLADRIGATKAGSISLSAEHSRDRSLRSGHRNVDRACGQSMVALRVARAAGPLSDRGRAVAAEPETTTLHAGFLPHGAIAGWRWDLTGTLDQKFVSGVNELNIDMTQANAASAAAPTRSRRWTPAS